MAMPSARVGRRRTKPDSERVGSSTRDRLLDTAERMFADRGFAGVSLRDIATVAKVNIAAAHYHFGSKAGLFEAVFVRRAAPVCELTHRMLDAAEEWRGRDEHLEQILRAYLVPTFRGPTGRSRDVRNYNRLRAHIIIVQDQRFARKLLKKTYAVLSRRIVDALAGALPTLPARELAWRFHILLGTIIFSTAPAGRAHTEFFHGAYEPDNPAEAITFLVPLLAAAFRAPVVREHAAARDLEVALAGTS